jgi:hypothetical protein
VSVVPIVSGECELHIEYKRRRAKRRTVELRVGDEAAWVDGQWLVVNETGRKRLAIATVVEIVGSLGVTSELAALETLDVAPVVLEEVGELVVQKHALWEVVGHREADHASLVVRRWVQVRILWLGNARGRLARLKLV